MDVQRLAVDVHQLLYGRAILYKWISFSMDVQRVAVAVHHLLYGRTTFHKCMSISFPMDERHDIRGRPSVSI